MVNYIKTVLTNARKQEEQNIVIQDPCIAS